MHQVLGQLQNGRDGTVAHHAVLDPFPLNKICLDQIQNVNKNKMQDKLHPVTLDFDLDLS